MRVFCGIWYSCQSCSLSTNTVVINTPHKSQESDFAAVPNICYLHKRPGQSIDYPEPHRISFMYLFVLCYGNPEVRTDDTWKALCSVYGACRLDPYCFWLVIGFIYSNGLRNVSDWTNSWKLKRMRLPEMVGTQARGVQCFRDLELLPQSAAVFGGMFVTASDQGAYYQ